MAQVIRRGAQEAPMIRDPGDGVLWTTAGFAVLFQLILAVGFGMAALHLLEQMGPLQQAADVLADAQGAQASTEAATEALTGATQTVQAQTEMVRGLLALVPPAAWGAALILCHLVVVGWAGLYALRASALGVSMPVALVVAVGLVPLVNLLLFVPLWLIVRSGLTHRGGEASGISFLVPILSMLLSLALAGLLAYGAVQVQGVLDTVAMETTDATPPTPSADPTPQEVQALDHRLVQTVAQVISGLGGGTLLLIVAAMGLKGLEALLTAFSIISLTSITRSAQRAVLFSRA